MNEEKYNSWQMIVYISGLKFVTKVADPKDVNFLEIDKIAEKFRTTINGFLNLRIELKDGSYLILGEKQLKMAVIQFQPSNFIE